MSANIPSSMPLDDLLKSTGYNCPSELQGKTFEEATSGGDTKISTNTDATIDVSAYTEPIEITPAEGYDATKKVTAVLTNIPSGGGAPSMSSPMCLALVNTEDSSVHYIGVLANGTIAQSTSDIPNIKWFVHVEGSSSGRSALTSSQDDFDSVFGDYSGEVGSLNTITECTVEIEGTNVSITNESLQIAANLALSDSIPLMLFVGINPVS